MMRILHRRDDCTFVIERNGYPWHVTADDPIFQEVAAAAEGVDLPPEPGPEAPPLMLDSYRAAIAAHVTETAGQRGYDSAAGCAGYVNSTVSTWAAEAAAFIAWRDQVYLDAFETLAAVQAGAPPPSIADLIAGLPTIEWPS